MSPRGLEQYGWNDRFAAAFAEHAGPGRVPARVVLEHTHIYRVAAADGETLARVSGRLRHRAETRAAFPAVGDWVVLEPVPDSDARADSHEGFNHCPPCRTGGTGDDDVQWERC